VFKGSLSNSNSNGDEYLTGLVAGGSHSCASTNLQLLCWGSNNSNQLIIPDVLKAGTSVLSAGYAHTCGSSWIGDPNNNDINDDDINDDNASSAFTCWGSAS